MEQWLSEDKQAVFHEEFCRSTNWSWTLLNLTGDQWRERSSETLQVNGSYFVTMWASRFWTSIEVWWGHCQQYLNMKIIYQSNFYSANISSEARLSAATAESVFNSKIKETVPHQCAIRHAVVYGGKAESKRCFLKVTTEVAEWTDSGKLFETDGAREWKALVLVLVLTLGTYRPIPLFDLSERDRSDVASMEWR